MNPVAGGGDPAEYGDRIADVYDDWHGERDEVGPIVEFLAAWAGERPALELGIGTGRIALPLTARGIRVDGIDASARMVTRLHAKAGGAGLAVGIGDFAEVRAPGGPYGLVYVVFNTFFALLTQEDQVRCFKGVAACLEPGGAFVLEAFVPDLALYQHGQQRIRVDGFEEDATRISAGLHDRASQRLRSRQLLLTADGVQTYPVELRYAWPSELDLMARLAGMTLAARWEGWQQRPFTSASPSHVSVWQTPGG
ncbi:MAG: class I SAM-dependent methyltransferase [Actinobacteria bacterium]|nr:class I SAM-dependent methyltransferase [Actinomycetota bacterium]